IDENGGRLTFKYERQFTINDYDYSKDYHLNISDVSSGYTLKVNGRYVGQIPSSVEASEFDITSLIHGGENRIEMSNVDQLFLNTHLSENMYILERDNDRLVHFEVEAVCQQDTEQILVTVKIKEVEGLPAITYTLIGLEGEIEAQGNIDLENPCISPIDASFEAVDLLDGYTLFLETDYETIAYFINKRDITIK
ncbi:sugar-binding domain-containing protein, partial [Staphylococcus felis]|uniref:sugar-binding domain-containing protein n=1 Tax=Staphylococcus felis TaxID=46127 RepID=UPI0015F2491A